MRDVRNQRVPMDLTNPAYGGMDPMDVPTVVRIRIREQMILEDAMEKALARKSDSSTEGVDHN